jgi:hypothetical protein
VWEAPKGAPAKDRHLDERLMWAVDEIDKLTDRRAFDATT